MSTHKTRLFLVGLMCLAIWPAHALEAPMHECDRLAAHPLDSNKVGSGVAWDRLEPDRAMPASLLSRLLSTRGLEE